MVLMPRQPIAVLNYRRIQMTEQQSEKQKMNALQKALIFTTRARELQVEDGYVKYMERSCGSKRFQSNSSLCLKRVDLDWLHTRNSGTVTGTIYFDLGRPLELSASSEMHSWKPLMNSTTTVQQTSQSD
jgi:hypothetical protein